MSNVKFAVLNTPKTETDIRDYLLQRGKSDLQAKGGYIPDKMPVPDDIQDGIPLVTVRNGIISHGMCKFDPLEEWLRELDMEYLVLCRDMNNKVWWIQFPISEFCIRMRKYVALIDKRYFEMLETRGLEDTSRYGQLNKFYVAKMKAQVKNAAKKE